jgi:glycerophosphoryl diester phosphodiesterase
MDSVTRLQPRIIGHRGASGYRPEHTRSAYELAFALGADAVEPDIVATRDGILVLRHENEISTTTDVASRSEFAGRRTTKSIDGTRLTGWFTEDFTWAELSTLRARERIPEVRVSSATFDGRYPMLRLRDLFDLIDDTTGGAHGALGMVAEIKHATYFESIGLPLDELFAAEVRAAGWDSGNGRLTIESFELDFLAKIGNHGVRGKRIFLVEEKGRPFDQVDQHGARATKYADYLTQHGLYQLAESVDGVSVNKSLILQTDAIGNVLGVTDLVDQAHAAGLDIYCWTLRPENRFLAKSFRRGRLKAQFGDWQSEFRLIMGSGIDGVFADHPDLVASLRDELPDELQGELSEEL